MRLLYLTHWFDPEPGVIKGPRFVRALEAAGYEVTVVTGLPNYPIGRFYPGYRLRPVMHETIDGARVMRLPLYPSHDASSFRRALTFLSFFVSVLLYCLLRRERYVLAYVYHPPITVGLAAALAGLIRPLPYVLDIQDLWPDTIATVGMGGTRRIARLLDPACRFVYRRASAIIVQSGGMRRALVERGVPADKITVIRNWADIDDVPPPEPRREGSNRLTIVYGGNFGRGQALATVIDAASLIERERDDIRIELYGSGIEAASLRELARRNRVSILRINDRIPQSEIISVFARADALLLHLAADPLFEVTIPSKTQFYLAMGRPIVAGIAGEAAGLLRESAAALVVPPQDPAALARAICEMADLSTDRRDAMARDGQRFYRRHLSFDRAMGRTLALLDEIEPAARFSRRASVR